MVIDACVIGFGAEQRAIAPFGCRETSCAVVRERFLKRRVIR
jgi:hypothetical protein